MIVPEVVITCCNNECGISFAVPSWWDRGKRETHTRFYCPNGHGQSYSVESDLEKTRRERDRLKQQMARVEEEAIAARLRAEKAERAEKRLKKRAAAASCPCCSRTFSNMRRHLATKHPAFVAENTSNVVPLKAAK